MNCRKMVGNQGGLTIIEVLIAATIFMAGFAIMSFLLGQLVGKYSSKDQTIAFNLAQEHMENLIATGDYISLDTLENVSNVSYRVQRIVDSEDNLHKIRINIKRDKTDRLLISLYNEKYIRLHKE